MIPYNKFRYIYPPRPENALAFEHLGKYDTEEYGAQPKLNGDNMLIFTNGIETYVYDRHKKHFKKNIKMQPIFPQLHRGKGWMVLCGEHMVKSKEDEEGKWNNKYVIFDIIVYNGMQLVGKTFRERIELLDALYGTEDLLLKDSGVKSLKFLYSTAIPDVYRVKTFYNCFQALWKDLVKIDMYEGLVLKRLDAQLENGISEKNNSSSQLKFRKPAKNYLF